MTKAMLPHPNVNEFLDSSPDGFTEIEAKQRLAQYGYYELSEKRRRPLTTFLS